jgi:hypothetical protein
MPRFESEAGDVVYDSDQPVHVSGQGPYSKAIYPKDLLPPGSPPPPAPPAPILAQLPIAILTVFFLAGFGAALLCVALARCAH